MTEPSEAPPPGAAVPDPAVLRAAVEAIDEAIVITGAGLEAPGPRILYVNPAFTRMTGYAPEELIGRSPRMLQGPGTDRAVLDRLRTAIKAGRTFEGEGVNYRKDGTPFIVEWLITPVRQAGRVTHWVSAQRDVTQRRREAERLRLLAREVDHRARNALAVVQSVLHLTPANEVATYRAAVGGRVAALSRAQTLLSDDQWQGVDMRCLLQGEVAHLGDAARRVRLDGPPLLLPPVMAQPFAIIAHELATNAMRHGSIGAGPGLVRAAWRVEARELRLTWVEEGGAAPAGPPARSGFGLRVMEAIVCGQLAGTLAFDWRPGGLACDIRVPLAGMATPVALSA
jgi:PAS domain S-box-containing protein